MIISSRNDPDITLSDIKKHLIIDDSYTQDDSLLEGYLNSAIMYCSEYIGVYPYGTIYRTEPEEIDRQRDRLWFAFRLPEIPSEIIFSDINPDNDLEFYDQEVQAIYNRGSKQIEIQNVFEDLQVVEALCQLDNSSIEVFEQAVKLLVSQWYDFRSDDITLSVNSLSTTSKILLDQITLQG